MDLEQYIIAKFCDFKFPLIKETENEVNLFKSKLNSQGTLHSGHTISGSYEIRLKSIRKMIDRYLEIEFETRKEKQVEINNEVLIKIENNLINFIEHEFENLINKTREEANLIGFGKDNFENKFKPKIIRDLEESKSFLKKSISMKDFELNDLKGLTKIKEQTLSIKNLKCFITGSNICTKKIEEKDDQIFLVYDYKNKEVDEIIENEIIPTIIENNLKPIRAKDKIVN